MRDERATPERSDPAAYVPAPAVRLSGVAVRLGDHPALTVDELAIPAGRTTAVLGPNGSGKTTLLRVLSGLTTPAVGHVEVLGGRPGDQPARVAHVLQEVAPDGGVPVTVREAVRMGRYAARGVLGRLGEDDRRVVRRAMARTGVAPLADRLLTELSPGQRRRVLLAQGLAQEADLLLLDEPGTGLDPPGRQQLVAVLDDERRTGRTVVQATHDLAVAARADHVVLLVGRVVSAGAPDEALVPAALEAAYGDRVRVGDDGAVVLDDPHHDVGHGTGP